MEQSGVEYNTVKGRAVKCNRVIKVKCSVVGYSAVEYCEITVQLSAMKHSAVYTNAPFSKVPWIAVLVQSSEVH